MLEIIMNLIISTSGSIIAYVMIEAVKNKKNNRPKPEKLDDHSSN